MALKEAGMTRTFFGPGPYELRAGVGESLLIKSINIDNTSAKYISVIIDKTTVGYFMHDVAAKSHIAFPVDYDAGLVNLLSYLYEKGIFKGYPVGEGQTFIVKGPTEDSAICQIIYDKYDAGDITPTTENGTQADTYFFINYGVPSLIPSSGGDVLIDKSENPAEFPSFPFGADVPARMEIDLLGIVANDVGKSTDSGANKARTRFLKMIKERVVLFDDERDGYLLLGVIPDSDTTNLGGGNSVFGYFSRNNRKPPLLFKEPLTFGAGEELNVIINTEVVAGSNNLVQDDLRVGAILRVRKTG